MVASPDPHGRVPLAGRQPAPRAVAGQASRPVHACGRHRILPARTGFRHIFERRARRGRYPLRRARPLPPRQNRGEKPGDPRRLRARAQGRAQRSFRTHHRGIRDWEGSGRPHDPHAQPPQQGAFRAGQLRSHPLGTSGKRVLRLPERRVHGSLRQQAGIAG